ncbi:MAG: PaaI family thioesterase [Alphaproteobacteria bacterium]|nr:PaaI family thioesterase [Alphaproteobacteria bacterium]
MHAFRRDGDGTALCAAVPFLTFLGVGFAVREGHVLGHLPFRDTNVGNPALPALHGGALGAVLEATAIAEILWSSEALVIPKTINLTVDYLRSARPVDTWARGIITKHGRRVINVRAEAWQDDPSEPVATATAHFLVLAD